VTDDDPLTSCDVTNPTSNDSTPEMLQKESRREHSAEINHKHIENVMQVLAALPLNISAHLLFDRSFAAFSAPP